LGLKNSFAFPVQRPKIEIDFEKGEGCWKRSKQCVCVCLFYCCCIICYIVCISVFVMKLNCSRARRHWKSVLALDLLLPIDFFHNNYRCKELFLMNEQDSECKFVNYCIIVYLLSFFSCRHTRRTCVFLQNCFLIIRHSITTQTPSSFTLCVN